MCVGGNSIELTTPHSVRTPAAGDVQLNWREREREMEWGGGERRGSVLTRPVVR